MLTHFNEDLAVEIRDIEVAILVQNIAYWLRHNAAGGDKDDLHFHDGKVWTYNSYQAWVKLFPVWTLKNIRTLIKKAVKLDLIEVGNFNRKSYDNTNWYTLTDKALNYFPPLLKLLQENHNYRDPSAQTGTSENTEDSLIPSAQTGRPSAQTGRPIPTLLLQGSINNTANGSSDKNSKEKNLNVIREMIDAYRETFPDNPQPHKTAISTSLEKTMRTLIKRWHEISEGNPFTIYNFRQYLSMLRSNAPGFSLNAYTTPSGRVKKNDLQTFCRWDTIVKFLEGKYS